MTTEFSQEHVFYPDLAYQKYSRMPIIGMLVWAIFLLYSVNVCAVEIDCGQLLMGQFMCPDPSVDFIDAKTQQPFGCTKENVARVWCIAAEGITCSETKNSSFIGEIPCQWT